MKPSSSSSKRAESVPSFKVMDVLQRANELQMAGHDVLHCEVGQPESGAPKRVAQAAVTALMEPQVMGYTDAFGLLSLRHKISQHYQTFYNHQWGVATPSTDRIVVTTGSSGAFLLAFTACFDVGDTVALASSGYPCYRNILSALGCTQASIPINDEFKVTGKELMAEIQRRKDCNLPVIKGFIMSSPSNPTGAMLTPSELKELCTVCDEHSIQFLSDEIYHGISYGTEEATALQFSERAIVINSFSKYYSMSGWRLGWMIIPKELIPAITSLQQNMFINAPTISQTAALECWEAETLAELNAHVEKYRTSRTIILEELGRLFAGQSAIHVAPADGGFYVYVDIGRDHVAPGMGTVSMCKALLEEEHVAFTPGNDFEDPASDLGDLRFRISYAGGIDTVKQAMERFHRFWPTWLGRIRKEGGH